MSDVFLFVLIAAYGMSLLFPLFFVFYRNGKNKFLFISSSLGASAIASGLLVLTLTPLFIFNIKIAPQLAANGFLGNVEFVVILVNMVEKYWEFALSPFMTILMTFLIYNKYAFFRK